MSIIPDCSSSLIFIQSQLDEKFRLALRQTFIDASNNYNTNENVENNCRRRTPVLDVSRVTCPPVKNNCRPYFNECKKNKIFNMQNQSNSSHKITQKDQYLRFVRGFGRNGHRRITNGSQNFLFTNPNVSNFKIFNNKPNVLNICQQPIIYNFNIDFAGNLDTLQSSLPDEQDGHWEHLYYPTSGTKTNIKNINGQTTQLSINTNSIWHEDRATMNSNYYMFRDAWISTYPNNVSTTTIEILNLPESTYKIYLYKPDPEWAYPMTNATFNVDARKIVEKSEYFEFEFTVNSSTSPISITLSGINNHPGISGLILTSISESEP